ncbi:ABC-type Fe3+-hydroxamate transport system periplasmic component [Rubrobacter radiotolerans]|uniref:ABC-type Fe3+-hydroxamate transport system periplasmic component n=1 Tax=Rubrobacter radiotolerans TaxID=42256 RepID=A0A023WZ04_RUBRA|nr:iron-siderophore ABC transporter substrate-binding protein [Rubrobacter radiotolerans]AHY45452.1 ABC-type Fe3+-hydroxamate transport system periplasmic component [Rubrobacter radiotolerans]MDX5892863.1 iron-siderophore ABC transporter substrate-binding protein [Rubrobacter radiotolerans]SMC02648.1 iron complex transport system substrate-binding protein [Rubrobacter radiotolerans DSM 5868]
MTGELILSGRRSASGLARRRFTRRRFLAGGGSLLLLGAVGCGGGSEEESRSGETRTIEHKYGSTEIEGVPGRVVSVGYTDQDPILALGGTLVGVREWFGEYEHAVWPWAEDELGDQTPETIAGIDSINFESVASVEPDLIVGISSGMTEQDYETLSEIAPTLPQSDRWVDFGVPWQEQTRVIGRALGHEDRANGLISDLEGRFETTREEYPELEGATVSVIGTGDGLFYFYTEEDRSTSFFTDLGFRLSEEAASLSKEGQFAVEISEEQFSRVDSDVLVCFSATPQEEEELRANELFGRLSAVREDRVVYLSDPEDANYGALSFNTILSTPYLLDNLVPEVADMVRRA